MESEVIVWWFVVLKKCEVIDFVSKTGKSFFGFGPARNSLFFTWVQRTFQTKAQKVSTVNLPYDVLRMIVDGILDFA